MAESYVFENPCPNPWHDHHFGVPLPGIRQYLTCPECPQARHYEIARLARRGAAMVVADIQVRDTVDRYSKPRLTFQEISALLDAGAEASDERNSP